MLVLLWLCWAFYGAEAVHAQELWVGGWESTKIKRGRKIGVVGR